MDQSIHPTPYARTFIQNVLANPEIPLPDLTSCGDLAETVSILHNSHLKGGPKAAQQSWDRLGDFRPELLQILKPAPRSLLLSVADLKNLPPMEFLKEGMLPKRSICVLYGPSASKKTLFGLQIAFNVAKTNPVLYVAGEGASGYAARMMALEEQSHELANDKLKFYLNSVNLLDDRTVANFIPLIEPLNPDLIVFDTLARCMVGGDENSSKDMGLVIAACDRIRNAVDATILLVHHTGKIGTGERGSSALRSACDSMMELTNHDGIVMVESSKLKDGKPFDTLYFTLAEYGDSVALVPTDSATRTVSKTNRLTVTDRKVLELLILEIYSDSGATYKRILDNTGIAGTTLDGVLSRLKVQGYLSQSKKGDPYFITDQGIMALTA